VGLYMNPPEQALVLSVDEKSQIQALDRTQPILPLRPGLPARQTHDYQRHGTRTLFAALNVLEGTVIGECQSRHRHQEFLRFLDRIDESVEAGLEIHLVWDNYGTQTSGSEEVVGIAAALSRPFHAHQFILAQSDRALVRRNHTKANPPWNLPHRSRPDQHHS